MVAKTEVMTMSEAGYLTNHFLIAMPGLVGSEFSKTVTYICQHDEEGALGIVINKTHSLTMGDIYKQLQISPATPKTASIPLFSGGPVEEGRGFVLHQSKAEWDSTLLVNEGLALTSSKDIMQAIAHDEGPENWLLALGYAGWASGQLEEEIRQNSWLHGEADAGIIFNAEIGQRWQLAAESIGVDISLMSSDVGHC
jgi:putative transcriptional regulator